MDIERYRKTRELRGLTKRQLSKLTGIREMQLVRYETGENDPSTENLTKLAAVLEVSSDYLLGITDDLQGHFRDNSLSEIEQEMISAYRREGWKGVFRLGAERMPG